jgi:hypothetical protein
MDKMMVREYLGLVVGAATLLAARGMPVKDTLAMLIGVAIGVRFEQEELFGGSFVGTYF